MKKQRVSTAKKKKAFIEALKMSLGIVTKACEATGIPRRTFYSWRATDEKFEQAVQEINEIALDFVETQLFNKIKKGDTTGIIFYLKCKGKKRGYIDTVEHSFGLDNSNLSFEMKLLDSSNEQKNDSH